MEVLTAASSIAGLLGLAGQCISGLQKLRELYQDAATASKTIETFLKDTDSLLQSLHDVRTLLGKIDSQPEPVVDDVATASLRIQLEDCRRDIVQWLESASASKPASGKSARAWFSKFWFAVNKESFSTLRADILQRRMELVLSLATLGRQFDLNTAIKAQSSRAIVEESCSLTSEVLDKTAVTQEQLNRLEKLSESIATMSVTSMRSLQSMASAMSSNSQPQIVKNHESPKRVATPVDQANMKRSPLSGAYTGTAHATSEARTNGSGISPRVARKRKLFSWSCSALTDPGFALFAVGREGEDPRSCGYCDHVFTGAANHHDMLEHVSKAHKFGQCNAAKKVFRENTFRLHLECSHFVDDGKALESLMILCMIPTQPQPMRHNTLELDALEDTGGEHPPSVVPRASTLATRDGMWHVHPDDQSNETDHQGSAAQETRSMSSPASDMLVPAVVDPADLDDEYGMGALMMGSWDASLLGQWTSPSDRINRWLLHTLGSDRENMLLHKDMFLDMFSHTDFAADVLSRRGWSRCVLKYWFIDEAATGVNFEEAVKSLESLRGGSELPRSLRVDSKKQTRYEDEACGEIAAEHSPVFESEDVDEEALEASPEVVDDSDFPPTFPANDIPRPFTGNRRARED